jgi:hypothetical protein
MWEEEGSSVVKTDLRKWVKFDQVVYSLDWLIQLKQRWNTFWSVRGKQIPIEFVQVLAILCDS